jgi:hypothetical protein
MGMSSFGFPQTRRANVVPTMNYPVRVNGMNMAMPLVINTTKTEIGDKIDFDDLLEQLSKYLNEGATSGNEFTYDKEKLKLTIRNLIKKELEATPDPAKSKYVYAEPADIDRFNKNMKYMIDNSKSQTGGASFFSWFGRPTDVDAAPVIGVAPVSGVLTNLPMVATTPITVSPVVLGVSTIGPAIIMPDFSFGLGLVFKKTISINDLHKEYKKYIERVFKNIINHADAIKGEGTFQFYEQDKFNTDIQKQIQKIIESNISQNIRHRFTGTDAQIDELGKEAFKVYKAEFVKLCQHITKICNDKTERCEGSWDNNECDDTKITFS